MDQLRDQLTTGAGARAGRRGSPWRPVRVAAAWPLLRRAALLALVAVAAASAVGSRPGATASTGGDRVIGGAASMNELMARFVAALAASDRDGLEALRLTKEEYVQLVMPGHVPPGQPPQMLSDEAAEYFFSVMNTKSYYFREALVSRYAGKRLELRDFSFEKGVKQYAGHRSYKRAILHLRDEDGHELELRSGSVVERDGRFKFASYIRD